MDNNNFVTDFVLYLIMLVAFMENRHRQLNISGINDRLYTISVLCTRCRGVHYHKFIFLVRISVIADYQSAAIGFMN